MPATAGRVRMPHNNRMHSSAALQMTGIWKNTIGYDPYAAEVRFHPRRLRRGSRYQSLSKRPMCAQDEEKKVSESAYEQAKGLMALAKLSNKSVRGPFRLKSYGCDNVRLTLVHAGVSFRTTSVARARRCRGQNSA